MTDGDRGWKLRAASLARRARDLPAGQRRSWLERVCGGDLALLGRALALLGDVEQAAPTVESQLAPLRAGAPLVPRRLGRYTVEAEIARGAHGVVCRARDEDLGRMVALKIPLMRHGVAPEAVDALREEARLLAGAQHPHVATIHAIERPEELQGAPVIVMELVSSETLADRLRAGRFPTVEALRVSAQVASALESAHARGIVHLDLKPGNVAVGADGWVKVLDFGIGRRLAGGDRPAIRAIAGTPGYMSPEQLSGTPADERSDVWALGCLLYELLSGVRAFPLACDPLDQLREHGRRLREGPDWTRLPEDAPEGIRRLVGACLSLDPAGRPRDGGHVRRSLEAALGELRLEPLAGIAPPAAVTSFVGRADELRALRRALEDRRLVTLVGPPGCGKTRLAAELLRGDARARWAELDAVAQGPEVARAIARAVGAAPGSGDTAKCPRLAEALASRELTVVLDNAEHVADACADAAASLLRAHPRLRLLGTSTRPLGLVGEWVFRLSPLGLPATDDPAGASSEGSDAVRLLAERLPPAALASAEDLARLACAVDGIPLALELAAGWLRVLPAAEVLDRIEAGAELPARAARHPRPPRRHASLDAMLEATESLLEAPERTVLRRLGVFDGPFTLEAVAAACIDHATGGRSALQALSALVEHSLVQQRHDAGPARFGLLRVVRSHARRRLRESGELDLMRARHRFHVLGVVSSGEGDVDRTAERAWIASLRADLPNVRAAFSASLAAGDAAAALRLAWAMDRAQAQWSPWREARDVLTRALDVEGAGAHPRLEARVLNALGAVERHLGRPGEARARHEEALARYRAAGDERGMASCENDLANLTYSLGEHDEAARVYRSCLERRLRLGDEVEAAVVRANLAHAELALGDAEAARRHLVAAVQAQERLGDAAGLANSLHGLGNLEWSVGRLEAAREAHGRALALRRELDDRVGVAMSLVSLGALAETRGALLEARSCFQEALAAFARLGDARGTAACHVNLAGLELTLGGDAASAHRLAARALRAFVAQGNRAHAADTFELMAQTLAACGRWEDAALVVGQADALREATGARRLGKLAEDQRADAIARVVGRIGVERFETERDRGRELGLDEAVARACEAA